MAAFNIDNYPGLLVQTEESAIVSVAAGSGSATKLAGGALNTFVYQHYFVNSDEETNYNLQYGWEDDWYNFVLGNDANNAITIRNLLGMVDAGAGDDRVTYHLDSKGALQDSSGMSELHGGTGTDTLIIDFATLTQGVDFNLTPGSIASLPGPGKVIDTHFYEFEKYDVRTGSGIDYLNGGAGDDRLNAGAGNDILVGNKGKDILTGGAGGDLFRFYAGDSGSGGANRDIITDFEHGADKIQLVGAKSFAISQIGDSALLKADFDGDGKFESHFTVAFAPGHSYSDFSSSDILLA